MSQPRKQVVGALPDLPRQLITLAVWIIVGFFVGYASLYAFTPLGIATVAGVWLVGGGLRRFNGRLLPEVLGMGCGVGAFLAFAGAGADPRIPSLSLAGLAVAGVSVVAYARLSTR